MSIFDRQDRFDQFVANAAIEGISFTDDEIALFAQLDAEDLTSEERIARIIAFCGFGHR